MSTERYIETLLQKYRQGPSFPFDDWLTNPVSAYALTNLWDDMFRVAAGDELAAFKATADLPLDEYSFIYDVIREDRRKRFTVRPQVDGGDFGVLVGWDNEDLPDRTELSLTSDLEPGRLAAAFEMMRHWVHQKVEEEEIETGFTLNDLYVERYRDRFTFPDDDPLSDEDDEN